MVAEEGPNQGPSLSHNMRESLSGPALGAPQSASTRPQSSPSAPVRPERWVREANSRSFAPVCSTATAPPSVVCPPMGSLPATILVLCLIGVVCAAPGSAATNARAGRRPAVLHPRFRLVANDVVSVAASDRYLVFTTPGFFAALIDRRTGARRTIEPPDCPGGLRSGLGGPGWLSAVHRFPVQRTRTAMRRESRSTISPGTAGRPTTSLPVPGSAIRKPQATITCRRNVR